MIDLTCPTCGKRHQSAAGTPLGPFCSPRCQLVDLGRWLSEEYRVPDSGPPPDLELEPALAGDGRQADALGKRWDPQ